MKRPDVDIGTCSLCMGCVELCPETFQYNDAGYIEIIEQDEYPEDCVDDAIMLCPEDCITWQEE
jgi:ferredoxin